MMKSINRIFPLLAFFLVSGLFMGCDKYEEGPKVSLRSRDARMANTWKVMEYIKDGNAVVLDENTNNIRYELTEDRDYFLYSTSDAENKVAGKWVFLDDNETLGLNNTTQAFPSAQVVSNGNYTITKLEESELWIERTNDNGNQDMIKFEGE